MTRSEKFSHDRNMEDLANSLWEESKRISKPLGYSVRIKRNRNGYRISLLKEGTIIAGPLSALPVLPVDNEAFVMDVNDRFVTLRSGEGPEFSKIAEELRSFLAKAVRGSEGSSN
jgi:hypothetical protein